MPRTKQIKQSVELDCLGCWSRRIFRKDHFRGTINATTKKIASRGLTRHINYVPSCYQYYQANNHIQSNGLFDFRSSLVTSSQQNLNKKQKREHSNPTASQMGLTLTENGPSNFVLGSTTTNINATLNKQVLYDGLEEEQQRQAKKIRTEKQQIQANRARRQ